MPADRPSLESVPLWGELDEAGIDTMVAFLEAETSHIDTLLKGKTSPAEVQEVVAAYNEGKTRPNDDPNGGVTELHAHRTPEGVLVALTVDRRGNTFLEYHVDRQEPVRWVSAAESHQFGGSSSIPDQTAGAMRGGLERDPSDWLANQGQGISGQVPPKHLLWDEGGAEIKGQKPPNPSR